MPNASQHVKIGAIAGGVAGAVYNLSKQLSEIKKSPGVAFDIWRLLGHSLVGAGLGAIAASLPDILEPAVSPHHRQFFHSISMMVVVGISASAVGRSGLDEDAKHMMYYVLTGYMSHLVADAGTPMGIRLI